MAPPSFSTERLDHLGIVAGFCQHIGLSERIDALLPAPERKVSHGEAVVAMVINALGFVSRPLYLFPEFLRNKPVDKLIGEGLVAADFNDDCLGRTLDALYDFGVTELFAAIAWPTFAQLGIAPTFFHLDSSSFSLDGDYNRVEPKDADDRHPVHITYGYSKDKRSDLKQVMLNLVTAHKDSLPVWLEALDGNSSDAKSFPATVTAFTEQLQHVPEPVFVMDAAGYSKNNVPTLAQHRFVVRVPGSIDEVQRLMATPLDEVGWCNGPDDDHRYRVFGSCYGDVPQRWVLVHSTPRQRHDHAAQQRKFATEREQAEKSSRALSRRRFACEADANAAATQMASSWRFHKASHQLVAHSHYEGRGRPKKDQPPDHVLWQVLVDVVDDEAAIAEALVGCGMYVVATNVLDASVLPASSMIELYREQGVSVERGFRFLKDPLFFASSLFLHKPSRIMALLMIMTLSLLVYCLCERHLREQLAQTAQTVPDQKGKPTSTPTLRRVFQMFDGIDLLIIRDDARVVRQILNLTDQHRHILGLFPAEVQILYEDPQEHRL